jgi:hypothetical protein
LTDIAPITEADQINRMPRDTSELELGQWYWVIEVATRDQKADGAMPAAKEGETYEWLGCAMVIGSNFVEIHSPKCARRGYHTDKVHFNDYWTRLRFEPNPERYINEQVNHWQGQVRHSLEEIQALTARLGVVPTTQIADQSAAGDNALVVLSSQPDVTGYKAELIKAKTETLPKLFEQTEVANRELARWMSAATLPMLAKMGPMKGVIEHINDSIFNISLYAGLTEQAVPCSEGDPAGMSDKLHIMQRRLYMDEESLLAYEAGGMDIRDIRQFDAWIARPENRDRLLPFPRTAVAFRVRRHEKERETGSLMQAFVNVELGQADKFTYLYIRNGDQVWRIVTEEDFGPKMFPDADYSTTEPMMMKVSHGRFDGALMTVREYEQRKSEYDPAKAEYDRLVAEWKAANPTLISGVDGLIRCPHRFYSRFDPKEWQPFDGRNVNFDAATKAHEREVKAFNRVGLIIQGLFDRSPVLHPHPPVQTWTQHGFERAVQLVYDASGSALYASEKAPDFDAYRRRLNATIGVGSIVTGQEVVWMRQEAKKENTRERRNARMDRSTYDRTLYRPYGNPGPGQVAEVKEWKPRSRQAVFRWHAPAGWRSRNPTKPQSITVGADSLFNVSAYQPGDFRQFFADPRSREAYLKWAPLMLAAEDYHAGKLRPDSRHHYL